MRPLIALFAAASLATACSSNPSAPDETQAPASVVNAALNLMLNSFTSSFNKSVSSRGVGRGEIRPLVQVFVQPPDQRVACSGGGYVSTSATMSGNVSNTTGEGTVNWQSYQSFIDCNLGGGWTIRSNPYESFGGTIGLFANHTSLNVRVSGGGNIFQNDRVVGTYYWTGVLLQWDNLTGWSNSGQFCVTPGPVCAKL